MVHCGCYSSHDFCVHLTRYTRYKSTRFHSHKTLNNQPNTFILFMMLSAQLLIMTSLIVNQRKILGQQRDRFNKSVSLALRALDSIIQMQPIATSFTKRMPTKNEQPWYIQFLIEFVLTVRAEHHY